MTDPAAVDAPARRGRPGHDQQTVLRRAIDLFNEQGYDATSMGDLARELGLTKSAIYHHVPSKSHLLAEALDEALDELTAVVEEGVAPADGLGGEDQSAIARLRRTVRRSVAVLVAHQPAVTRLLRVRGNSDVEQAAQHRRRELDARLAGLVREAMAEGSLRDDVDPDVVSRLLFGMVNSLVEWYRPGGSADVELLSHAITAMAFDGLDAHQS